MSTTRNAIEVIGNVEDDRHISFDELLPVENGDKVRVIVILPEDDDIPESEWLRAASVNPVFDFLKDPAEDIYTINDGEPYHSS